MGIFSYTENIMYVYMKCKGHSFTNVCPHTFFYIKKYMRADVIENMAFVFYMYIQFNFSIRKNTHGTCYILKANFNYM